ncbi:tetratricopeptide repeat protein [Desulfosarcina cetonica]|uniref:tetratricopeptide repeat protein n=1 Tax=Desulfosarcina cetonica TaxID=90730 RepID=UPI001C46835F|nr:hypothetical protein [Desulfosarcina cetonica]
MILLGACGPTGQGLNAPATPHLPAGKEQPVNAYYLFAKAHIVLKQGNIDQAISIMQAAIALDPASAYLKRELAGMWLLKKKIPGRH